MESTSKPRLAKLAGTFSALIFMVSGVAISPPVWAATGNADIDTATIQGLLDRPVDGVVRLPQGVFVVSPTLKLRRGVKIIGSYTVLKVSPGAGSYVAMLTGVQASTDLSGLSITGVIFDQNTQQAPASTYAMYHGSPRFAVAVYRGSGIEISGNQFLNSDNLNTVVTGTVVDHAVIRNNIFKTTDPALHDHSSVYTNSRDVQITGNFFYGSTVYGAAIETHGDRALIAGNKVYGYYRGANIVSSTTEFSGNAVFCGVNLVALWSLPPDGLHDVTIRDNRLYYPQPGYWQALLGIRIPDQYLRPVIEEPSSQLPFVRITVEGNR